MATINLGAIKFNWTGAYNSSTSYAVDDVVSSGGNSYVCIQAHSNQAVGDATAYWNIMSSAGSNGTDLTSTLSARGDLVFKGASALTRLPKGTAGYYLKQGANDPEWGEIASGGKIGALTNMIKKDTWINTAQTTWTEVTAYNLSITPTKAGSTILITGHLSSGSGDNGPAGHGFTLYRSVNGASNSAISGLAGDANNTTTRSMVAGASESGATWIQENGAFNVMDTSGTGLSYSLGNAIKYTMYNFSASGANSVYLNRSKRDENSADDVRTTSSMTLMEVLA